MASASPAQAAASSILPWPRMLLALTAITEGSSRRSPITASSA